MLYIYTVTIKGLQIGNYLRFDLLYKDVIPMCIQIVIGLAESLFK